MKVPPPLRARFAWVPVVSIVCWLGAFDLAAEDPPVEADPSESPTKGMMERLQRRLSAAGEEGGTNLLTRLGEVGAQLAEIKQAALGNAAAMEQLRRDVEQLKQEVATMKRLSAAGLAGGAAPAVSVGTTSPLPTTAGALAIQAPTVQPGLVITALELAEAYGKDAIAADKEYRDNFLTVVGRVDNFTTGSSDGDLMVQMRTSDGLPRIKFFFNRDLALPVEVRPHEGRIVWSENKTTLLQMGQQLVISGTCTGRELDVLLTNCRVEGLPKPPPPAVRATPTPRPTATPRVRATPGNP